MATKIQKLNLQLSKLKLSSARRSALLGILDEFDDLHKNDPTRNVPLDIFLRFYFLRHKNVFDSAARAQLVDMVYTLQRYKGYLNAISSRK